MLRLGDSIGTLLSLLVQCISDVVYQLKSQALHVR